MPEFPKTISTKVPLIECPVCDQVIAAVVTAHVSEPPEPKFHHANSPDPDGKASPTPYVTVELAGQATGLTVEHACSESDPVDHGGISVAQAARNWDQGRAL